MKKVLEIKSKIEKISSNPLGSDNLKEFDLRVREQFVRQKIKIYFPDNWKEGIPEEQIADVAYDKCLQLIQNEPQVEVFFKIKNEGIPLKGNELYDAIMGLVE